MTPQTFEYPIFFKLLYRYGNIPVTILLSLYLIPSVINLDKDLIYIIPVVALLTLIYFLNRRYLYLYQVVPYKITADEEKLICENFFLSDKETIIFYRDIGSLSGGIFSGKLKGLMKVNDGKSKICIGFFDKIRNVKDLQTIILSRVNSEVYNKVVESVGLKKKDK
jgi:hypothetical protein